MSDSLRPHGLLGCQAPRCIGFSRQEYWRGLPFPSPGDLPNPGIEPWSPTLQADSLLSEPPGKQIELNPARNQNCVINVQDEGNCSVPAVSYCWQPFNCTISHLLSLLQSVAHLACSLHASPCMPAAVLYFSRSCTVRLNIIFFTFCACFFLCIVCMKNISLLQYSPL